MDVDDADYDDPMDRAGTPERDGDAAGRSDEDEEDEGVDDVEEDDEEEEPDGPEASSDTLPAAGAEGAGGADYVRTVRAVPTLEALAGLRELGREALCWQLSSAKPGNGVEQIRDPSVETYWQSDGAAQPHHVQLHWGRRVAVSHVCLYLDFQLDESYTPRTVLVEFGTTSQDLVPAGPPVELVDPSGWCIIPLRAPPDPLDDPAHFRAGAAPPQQQPVRAHMVRVSILSMHQNGRDTHVRHLRLYGPRLGPTGATAPAPGGESPLAPRGGPYGAADDAETDSEEASAVAVAPWGRHRGTDGMGMLSAFACIR